MDSRNGITVGMRGQAARFLQVLLAAMVSACGGTGKPPASGYDPCSEMKKDREAVATLESEVDALESRIGEALKKPDSAAAADLTAKLEPINGQLKTRQASLQKNAGNCDDLMKSQHRYPRNPEQRVE